MWVILVLGCFVLGCFIQFRGWVISDVVGGSFQPIFRVSHFGIWLFWPKSESDNYMCMHYYMCMNGQMGRC